MTLLFLILLLAALLWWNRGLFGFTAGPSWLASDQIGEDGSRKWLCSQCGSQVSTGGETPPPCDCRSGR